MTVDSCPPDERHRVQLAEAADIDGVAAALVGAFDGYAWTSWTVPPRDHTRRLHGLFHVTVSEIGLPHGNVWISRCPLTDEIVGAAVALQSDREVPVDVWQRVAAVEEDLMAERLTAAREAEVTCQKLRPAGPHVVLATLGVRRDHQRRGIATALLREVVRAADSWGVPTHLQTSSATNLTLYQQSGFSTSGEVQIPGGGPIVWGMARPPSC